MPVCPTPGCDFIYYLRVLRHVVGCLFVVVVLYTGHNKWQELQGGDKYIAQSHRPGSPPARIIHPWRSPKSRAQDFRLAIQWVGLSRPIYDIRTKKHPQTSSACPANEIAPKMRVSKSFTLTNLYFRAVFLFDFNPCGHFLNAAKLHIRPKPRLVHRHHYFYALFFRNCLHLHISLLITNHWVTLHHIPPNYEDKSNSFGAATAFGREYQTLFRFHRLADVGLVCPSCADCPPSTTAHVSRLGFKTRLSTLYHPIIIKIYLLPQLY